MAKYLDLVGLTAYNNKLKTVYPKNISYGNYTPTAGGGARKGFSYQIDVESNNTQTTNTVTIVDVSTLNSDLPTFTAPTNADTPGVKGLVPGAAYADINKFLKADGSWATPTDTTYTQGDAITILDNTISNAGVREVTAGTSGTTGQVNVNKNGTTAAVTISGVPNESGTAGSKTSTATEGQFVLGSDTNLAKAKTAVQGVKVGTTSLTPDGNKIVTISKSDITGLDITASDVGALADTTKYAGSSTAGGSATSAEKLSNTSTIGSTTQPVYFTSSGVPEATTYSLAASVPSDAVFTDRYVNSALFADDTTASASSPVKMTLTRAGSDTQTVTANIPKVSNESAGVVPKGASVSTQSQTTKFLREDGTWQAPSYTEVTSTYSSTGTTAVNGTAVAAALATLPSPMVFRGTLGTGGTITELPVNGTANIGDTYKVITDGTYASQAAKVGDLFTCLTKTTGANTWTYIPSGDDTYTDTWRNIKVNGTEKLGSGITSGAVDFINGTNTTVEFSATGNTIQINATDTTYEFNTAYNASTNKAATMDDITKQNVGLGNVTNNAQVKGLASGTTSGHLVTWGSDGYTVADSGVEVKSTALATSSDAEVPTSKAVATYVTGLGYKTSLPELGCGYTTSAIPASGTTLTASLTGYTLTEGGSIKVKFTSSTSTAVVPASATLNINSTGAKAIYNNGAAITAGEIKANTIITLVYDGTHYEVVNGSITDTEINGLFSA